MSNNNQTTTNTGVGSDSAGLTTTNQNESISITTANTETSNANISTSTGDAKLGIATFLNDDDNLDINIHSSATGAGNYASNKDSEISAFLSRPIKVGDLDWIVGTPLSYSFDPWDFFLTHPKVKEKINYYKLFRGDLVISIKANGTPFHYGRAMMTYLPFPTLKPKVSASVTLSTRADLMSRSQRKPILLVDPYMDTNVSMTIPYFSPRDYIDMETFTTATPPLGVIDFDELTGLTLASSSASNNVTITIFIHAINVELTIPTPITNNMDEFKPNGVVSKPAAALAGVANSLSKVPIIGNYALAASIGASAVSNIASLFGYSKPKNVADTVNVTRDVFTDSANTIGNINIHKLTLDPKQNTTIDRKLNFLDDTTDEMTISSISSRYSYILQFPWDATDLPDAQLASIAVCPVYAQIDTQVGIEDALTMASCTFASFPFKFWGGSMVYKISMIASQYHRGRIRVSYIPSNSANYVVDSYNTAYSVVLDLDSNRDVEICVSMVSDMPYLAIPSVVNITTSTGTFNILPPYDTTNGKLIFSVVNELVSPLGTANASIIVYAKAGEDFNVFGFKDSNDAALCLDNLYGGLYNGKRNTRPEPLDFGYSLFPLIDKPYQFHMDVLPSQAESIQLGGDIKCVQLTAASNNVNYDQRALISHGDPIVSFRNILKRWDTVYNYMFFYTVPVTQGVMVIFQSYFYRNNFPMMSGESILGQSVKNYYYDGELSYNKYVNLDRTTLLSYLGNAYAGWKGGIRYRYYVNEIDSNSANGKSTMSVTRISATPNADPTTWSGSRNYGLPATALSSPVASVIKQFNMVPTGGAGYAVTNTSIQPNLEVEIPNYNRCRFYINTSNPQGYAFDGSHSAIHKLQILTGYSSKKEEGTEVEIPIAINGAVSTAEDFQFIYYTGPPTFGLRTDV
jgi:hypothetical protein